ncbi:MAG: hypothetical protein GC153_03000 [Alphaproteobacteria bacterium]|nr:hypothetical protein [Alphaproteobacteria bacterium]
MRVSTDSAFNVQDIVRSIDESRTAREIVTRLANYAARFGFTTVGMGHIINPALHSEDRSKVFQLSTWTKEWVDHWMRSNVLMRDPVARYSLVVERPFRWKDAFEHSRFKDKKVEAIMREFGFADGMAFPMRTEDGPPGSVSFGASNYQLNEREIGELEIVSLHAYSKIERLFGSFPYQPPAKLTARESEVLHFVAGGKTNWEIGKVLSISEHSVRDHIRDASRKLGTCSRAHTVAVAIRLGLILP